MDDTHSHGTHYKTLGVNESANMEDIKRAFRTLAKKHHPDMGGSVTEMRRISLAYKVLSDPVERVRYDRTLHPPRTESTHHSERSSERARTHEQTHAEPKPKAAPREDKRSVGEMLLEEKQMVAQMKRAGAKTMWIGIALAVVGLIITGIGYSAAEDGGSYTVLWGLVLWGGFLFIKGWYNLLTPYAALHKQLDTPTKPYPFYLEKTGSPGRAIGIIIVSVVAIVILIGIIGSSGSASTSSGSSTTNESDTYRSTGLKTAYDNCIMKYDSLKAQLSSVESQMEIYDTYDNTASYNALVPQQNSLVQQVNDTYAQCESDRSAYNDSL